MTDLFLIAHKDLFDRLTQQRIANHFNVSQVIISQIKTSKRWSHVK